MYIMVGIFTSKRLDHRTRQKRVLLYYWTFWRSQFVLFINVCAQPLFKLMIEAIQIIDARPQQHSACGH